jgi:hypothetical protein
MHGIEVCLLLTPPAAPTYAFCCCCCWCLLLLTSVATTQLYDIQVRARVLWLCWQPAAARQTLATTDHVMNLAMHSCAACIDSHKGLIGCALLWPAQSLPDKIANAVLPLSTTAVLPAVCLQLVMGGRYYSISPDEYIFAALNIYLVSNT